MSLLDDTGDPLRRLGFGILLERGGDTLAQDDQRDYERDRSTENPACAPTI